MWFALVALPLSQFLVLRWLWRWALWAMILFSLARLELRPVATHPDRAGGFGLLSLPTEGFAVFLAAVGAALSGAWAMQVLDGASVASLVPNVVVIAVVALAVGLAPLLPFVPGLHRARLRQASEYGELALFHDRAFRRRWIERRDGKESLGAPDMSSLADLGSAYREMSRMRVVPFGRKTVLVMLLGLLLPLAPLPALELPLVEIVIHLAKVVPLGHPA